MVRLYQNWGEEYRIENTESGPAKLGEEDEEGFTAGSRTATLIDRNSGLLYGLPAYGLAGFTAFERVEAGRHYASDVLAGAAIGALSAGIMDSLHWGAGPGRGIARPGADLRVGFVDRCQGVELSLEFGF